MMNLSNSELVDEVEINVAEYLGIGKIRTRQPAVNPDIFAAMRAVDRKPYIERLGMLDEDEVYMDTLAVTAAEFSKGELYLIDSPSPTDFALRMHYLGLKKGQTVFHVGTGIGFEPAVISRLVGPDGRVLTTEINKDLAKIARETIERNDQESLSNLSFGVGDFSGGSSCGYFSHPVDAVYIGAGVGCRFRKKRLFGMLAEGGVMMIPWEYGTETLLSFIGKLDGRSYGFTRPGPPMSRMQGENSGF